MHLKRSIVSFVVACFISFIILLILNDYGITWDEPIHFKDAEQYVAWLKKPEWGSKEEFFKATVLDVHPPLRKLLAGLTHEILTNNLRIVDNTRGYRISSLLFVFPFVFGFTYVAIGFLGYTFGILASFVISFLPHVLFLTPLVTMDYAIMVLWFFAVIAGTRAITSRFWQVMCGISIGLTMLTKLHGFLLFIPIGIFWFSKSYKTLMSASTKKRLIAISGIGLIIITATLIYFAGWPALWSEPIKRLSEYFSIQLDHDSVLVYIFGQNYPRVASWYVPIMFASTTPLFVLAFFILGIAYSVITKNGKSRLFYLNAFCPMLLFMLPFMYRYDWVRLFLPAFPFVVLVAGYGMKSIADQAKGKLKVVVTGLILLLWFITLWFSVIRIHPWESSYYSEVVGGISGANKRGFETEFWGNAYLGILPWMNAHKSEMMCVTPTTHPFYYYQAMGQIEGGVVFTAGLGACKYVVVLMRQGLFIKDPFIDRIVKTRVPINTVSVQGVTLVGVYDISDTTN